MSDAFAVKVVSAATQGAVGATVGATLSACTEPIVNKILVERKSPMQAFSEHSPAKIFSFFQTTISTNFIKFPFFEIVNMLMNSVDVSPSLRGTVTGVVFTSATLPITNYRFKKSMNLPIGSLSSLYQAFLPTIARDVVYGIARNQMSALLLAGNPDTMKTPGGRFKMMFMTVIFSCVVSAPGNELRGFVLQPKGREKPFMEFFDPVKTVRSTTIGGLIMATSLGVGALCTPFVEQYAGKIKEWAKNDPLGAMLLLLALVDKIVNYLRFQRVEKKLKAIAPGD